MHWRRTTPLTALTQGALWWHLLLAWGHAGTSCSLSSSWWSYACCWGMQPLWWAYTAGESCSERQGQPWCMQGSAGQTFLPAQGGHTHASLLAGHAVYPWGRPVQAPSNNQ